MTESKVSVANREKMEAEKYFYWIQAVKMGINTTIEQGLWVALMVDMGAISGKNYKGTFLFEQRKTMIELIDTITRKDLIDGFLGIGKIPNPGYYAFRMLRPLLNEMQKTDFDEGGKFYCRMDPIPAALLIFVFPGLLKLIIPQIGEILPG